MLAGYLYIFNKKAMAKVSGDLVVYIYSLYTGGNH
jgi:hypothetical protein